MSGKFISVIDFGSSKIKVMVGKSSVNNNFNICSTGESNYGGFMDGEFLEPSSLQNCIMTAINSATVNLDQKIDKLYIGVPAEFCFCAKKKYALNFKYKTKISQKHIDLLFNNSAENEEDDTHTIISKSPISLIIDDNYTTQVIPIGEHVSSISVDASVIYAENSFIDNINCILDELKIKDREYICSALAEGMYLLDEEVRKSGAVIIDCGYITTNVAYIKGDGLLELKSFSLGGGHITGDLSEILKLSFIQAENLKRKLLLTVQPSAMDYYDVVVNGKMQKIDAKTANDIASSRIDLIVETLKKCIEQFSNKIGENTPIYLTGGGLSYIKGIRDYLFKNLHRKITIAMPEPMQLAKPDMSSIVSLLDTAINQNRKGS